MNYLTKSQRRRLINKAALSLRTPYENLTEKEKTFIWKVFDKINIANKRKLEKINKDWINKIYKDIVDKLNSGKFIKSHLKASIQNENLLINSELWIQWIYDMYPGIINTMILTNIEEGLILIDEATENIAERFNTQIAKTSNESINKIVISANTFEKEIKENIREILNSNRNATVSELTELIKDDVDNLFTIKYTNRAGTIAQTTSTTIQSESQNAAWSNIEGYDMVWVSQRDSKVRKEHREADGQKKKNGFYRVGSENLTAPAKGSKPENNINCRCSQIPSKKKN